MNCGDGIEGVDRAVGWAGSGAGSLRGGGTVGLADGDVEGLGGGGTGGLVGGGFGGLGGGGTGGLVSGGFGVLGGCGVGGLVGGGVGSLGCCRAGGVAGGWAGGGAGSVVAGETVDRGGVAGEAVDVFLCREHTCKKVAVGLGSLHPVNNTRHLHLLPCPSVSLLSVFYP